MTNEGYRECSAKRIQYGLHSFSDCYMYLLFYHVNYRVAVFGLILSKNQRKKKKMKRRRKQRSQMNYSKK